MVETYNGVPVSETGHPLEKHPNKPEYETGLIESIRSVVEPDDSVVNIGGGIGVSSVVAAEVAGPNGDVIVYEAAEALADVCRATVEMNAVDDRVEVRHTLVSEGSKLLGDPGDPDTISADELPACDVLVMDCEGAERLILLNMTIDPRAVIVETHGHLAATPRLIRRLLKEQGYVARDERLAEAEPQRESCKVQDVRVLTAESVSD